MATITVRLSQGIAMPYASPSTVFYRRSSRGVQIIAPAATPFVGSSSLIPRYLEIYNRAVSNELRLRMEIQEVFSSVHIVELEKELTRLIDDFMCLKRMKVLLPLDSIHIDPAPFKDLEKHTHALWQKIRCMSIITQLHFLRDELDPRIYERDLLGCLLKARAHIPCLGSKKQPLLIDSKNKMLFENLLFVIRDRFLGLNMGEMNLENFVSFIENEDLHLIKLDGLLEKLSDLIKLVKDNRFETAAAEKIRLESLVRLRIATPAK